MKPLKTIGTSVDKKNAKFEFFQRGWSIVFIEKLRFLKLLCFCKIDQEKVSGDILVRKQFFCNPL